MTGPVRAVPSAVNSWSPEYLEAEYNRFKQDPESVSPDFRAFFLGFDLARAAAPGAPASGAETADALRLQYAASNLIDSYRRRGHLAARTDPFGRDPDRPASLSVEYHHLTEADLDRHVAVGSLPIESPARLRDVIDLLERTYCGSIGADYMHISNDEERRWLAARVERNGGRIELDRGVRVHILEQLVRTEQFEVFLQKRYPGEKRFSLEGGESLIPCLDQIVETAASLGVEEIVLGMPHRGRLNVLNNILGKTYEQVFTEFEDNWEADFADGGGDVKYHRGYSGDRTLRSGKTVHLALASNPSHLESVDAVVEGRCRAKQRLRGDTERTRVIPLLIHGDAAVIAQGVVAEVLNFSGLEGYTTGGTIHIVVNNLIGFTTGPEDARTSRYCTDIAMMIEAPVFHVNGEDPEAVVTAAQIMVEYRQKFRKDVFTDLICFRKYGHNEQDEPSFTQPILAGLIKRKPGVLQAHSERLLAEGVLTDRDMSAISDRLTAALEAAQEAARSTPFDPTIDPGSQRWSGYGARYSFDPVQTGAPIEVISEVCAALGRVPDGFTVNPKLVRLLADRASLPKTGDITYADAESIAWGTLLLEGHAVRLSGQDSRRGTFSHRHAVLRDFKTGDPYIPLNHMREVAPTPDAAGVVGESGGPGADGRPTQGRLCVYDSPLSEVSVLGFEYGYSLADPKMLVMWEAQFGDFINGAQVVIDQYLASARLKWDRWSGLVLLLPHGYEGAGPEHSSARMERFLQLCADDNLQIVYPSTAAQTFHMFRRQVKAPTRTPLVVMTPKSLLRTPTSTIDELTTGFFHAVLDDPAFESGGHDRRAVREVLLCSGKIFHELAARRDAIDRRDIAIVRLEQLYPFHEEMFRDVLGAYPPGVKLTWVQEEPRNAAAFFYMADLIQERLGLDRPGYIGRPPSASPAVGSKSKHKREQEAILVRAVGAEAAAESKKPAPGTGANNGSGRKHEQTTRA